MFYMVIKHDDNIRLGDIVFIRLHTHTYFYARVHRIIKRCKKCDFLQQTVAYTDRRIDGPSHCLHDYYDECHLFCRQSLLSNPSVQRYLYCERRLNFTDRPNFTVVRNITKDMCARKIYAYWIRYVTTLVLAEKLPNDIVRIIMSYVSKARDSRENVWLNGLDASALALF